MNLRNVFLLASVCTFGNIHCSSAHKDDPQMIISSTDSHDNAGTAQAGSSAKLSTASARTQSDEIPKLIPIPHPSNVVTRVWYGISKHVAGMSAYAIFMELHNNGKIKADFNNKPGEAMNRFNETAEERFIKKDLLAADKQAKIALLFATADDISAEFALAKALAATYLKPQRVAVISILKKQALIIEPALRAERRSVIKEAKLKYTRELTKELAHAKDAASNCQYLYDKAEACDDFDYQDENHYTGLTEYSALLESIQEADVETTTARAVPASAVAASTSSTVHTISSTNAADEAAYAKYSKSYDERDLA